MPAQVPPPGLPPSPSPIKWQCEKHRRVKQKGTAQTRRETRWDVYIPTFTGVLMSNGLECILYQGKASDSEEECIQTATDLMGTKSTCYLEQEGSTTCYATKGDAGHDPETEYEGDAHKERRDRVDRTKALVWGGIVGVILFGICSCACCLFAAFGRRDCGEECNPCVDPSWLTRSAPASVGRP